MPDDARSDEELMGLVKGGDEGAFVELVRRHQEALLNFFRRMGAYRDDAEDMAQETFIRLFGCRASYRPTGRFAALLYTLARHVWADRLRKLKRRADTGGDAGVLDAPDGAAMPEKRLEALEALARLSEKLRAVVVLNVYHGLSFKEIAGALGIPLGTVKSRMFLALRELRELLEDDSGGK